MIFSKSLLAWDIRAIVRWLEHSRNVMYIDLFHSIDHLHVSHIFLHRTVTIFVPSSPVTFITLYCIYDRNLAFYYSERLESIRGNGQKVRIDD